MKGQVEMTLIQEARDRTPNTGARTLTRNSLHMLFVLFLFYLTGISVAPRLSPDTLCSPRIVSVAAQIERDLHSTTQGEQGLQSKSVEPLGGPEHAAKPSLKRGSGADELTLHDRFSAAPSLETHSNEKHIPQSGEERQTGEETRLTYLEEKGQQAGSTSGKAVSDLSPKFYEDSFPETNSEEYVGDEDEEDPSLVPEDDDMNKSIDYMDRTRVPFAGVENDDSEEESRDSVLDTSHKNMPLYQKTPLNTKNEQTVGSAKDENKSLHQKTSIDAVNEHTEGPSDKENGRDLTKSSPADVSGLAEEPSGDADTGLAKSSKRLRTEGRQFEVDDAEHAEGTVGTQLADESFEDVRHPQTQDGESKGQTLAGMIKHPYHEKSSTPETLEHSKGSFRSVRNFSQKKKITPFPRVQSADEERIYTSRTSRHKRVSKKKQLIWSVLAIIAALAGAGFLKGTFRKKNKILPPPNPKRTSKG